MPVDRWATSQDGDGGAAGPRPEVGAEVEHRRRAAVQFEAHARVYVLYVRAPGNAPPVQSGTPETRSAAGRPPLVLTSLGGNIKCGGC